MSLSLRRRSFSRRCLAFVPPLALVVAGLLGGCKMAARAASEDPMKCERDPKCEKKRGRTQDCSMQCSDDPACVERCEQVQSTTKLGR